jgi:hypothetical protein
LETVWPGKSAKRVFALDVPAIYVFGSHYKKDVDTRHRRQVYAVCARQTAMAGHDENYYSPPVELRPPRSSLNHASPIQRRRRAMNSKTIDEAMPTIAEPASVSKPALWLGRVLSGLVILFLLFDGAIKLVPWPVVTETMDRIGYGSSENLARSLGAITIACTVLYAIPPTSILGAILLTGYLGGAMASHLRIASPLFSHTLFGFYLGLMLWGGLWLRYRSLRALIPLRR